MKLLILAVLAVVAATRADYHDDVFHFSTLRSPVSLSRAAPLHQDYRYQALAASAAPASYYQRQYYQPAATQYYSGQYTPAATQYYTGRYTPAATQYYSGQYTPAATHYYSGQYTPAATQYYSGQYAPVAATQYHSGQYAPVAAHYYQPAKEHTEYQSTPVVFGQVPATTAYSSAASLSSLYARSGAASASAYAPAYSGPQYRILKQVQEVDPSGPYRMHYVTENGISASEEGSLVAAPEGPAVAKRGSYSYTGPDGVQYSVNWVADENGFRASGAHLPQAPEVAAAPVVEAQRSLFFPSAQYAVYKK